MGKGCFRELHKGRLCHFEVHERLSLLKGSSQEPNHGVQNGILDGIRILLVCQGSRCPSQDHGSPNVTQFRGEYTEPGRHGANAIAGSITVERLVGPDVWLEQGRNGSPRQASLVLGNWSTCFWTTFHRKRQKVAFQNSP